MNSGPVFRKAFVPWYDTQAACIVFLLLTAGVLLFSVKGLVLAGKMEEPGRYIWIPLSLLIFSSCLGTALFFRLVKRIKENSLD